VSDRAAGAGHRPGLRCDRLTGTGHLPAAPGERWRSL